MQQPQAQPAEKFSEKFTDHAVNGVNLTEQTADFVAAHRTEDVRQLALKAKRVEGLDLPLALDQIAGWQIACKKLPQWASCEGIIYPPHISMEQCSSQFTAQYKSEIAQTLLTPAVTVRARMSDSAESDTQGVRHVKVADVARSAAQAAMEAAQAAQQAAQAFVVPCLANMGQPVPRHDLQTTPEAGLDKNAALGLDATAMMCPAGKSPHVKAVWSAPGTDQAAPQHDPHAGLRFRSPPPEAFEDTVLENDGLAAFNVQFIRIPGAAQHQLARAPDDTASKNGTAAPYHAHSLIQLPQRVGGQVDEAILYLSLIHI